MVCPNCSSACPDGALECRACGVIFSKLKTKAEKAPVRASSTLGSTLILLACLCTGLYGAYRIYVRRIAPPLSGPKGVRLNPEDYKADILAVDKAVYERQGSVQKAAAAAEAAARRIAASVTQKYADDPQARDAAADILEFASRMAGPQESLGASSSRLESARAWETLRAKRFAEAGWFHPAEAPGFK